MNDTSNFIKKIDSIDISSVVTHYFDELMVLYNLVGSRTDIDISANDNASIATFTIIMNSDNDAKLLYDSLNGTNFSVYGCMYSISMSLSDVSITTVISKYNKDN